MKRHVIIIMCSLFALCIAMVLVAFDGKISIPSHPLSEPTRIMPSDLEYKGAFRMPSRGFSDAESWDWGGTSMTFYPAGDPFGPDDGYTGSIFGTGHEQHQYVSEISIPVPVVSTTKNLDVLNTAVTLQDFQDIRGDFLGDYVEIARVGLEYLSKQGSQVSDKIHFCLGQHFQEDSDVTHGWFELSLAEPDRKGGWVIGDQIPYSVNDYIFEIPLSWADVYTPGMLLATGRYRDGGWSGQGPSLFAYGHWNDGNPPLPGTFLSNVPLLKYDSSDVIDVIHDTSARIMDGYHHSDEWSGGEWITTGDRSAVIFVGTKGVGEYWYGYSDGTRVPTDGSEFTGTVPPYPHDDRGWWSTRFEAQILFYDPDDLAAVAMKEKDPFEPQPYSVLNIDQYLFHLDKIDHPDFPPDQNKYRLGAACFNPSLSYLYVFEFRGDRDNDRPLVHVWKVASGRNKKVIDRR